MARPTILVVDDEIDMCWLLTEMLQSQGYDVMASTTAQGGVYLSQGRPADLAIIDCKLPDMDGLALVNQLHQVQPNLTVLLISGYYYAEDRDVEERLRQGVVSAYISKPFEIDDVRRVVARLLSDAQVSG